MASGGPDAFNHALHTANIWLADIGAAFGTRDRRYSQRALRAWLHTLRDRLTVDAAAKFGAQLPELLRGAYYDGWEPNRAPVKYGVDQYIQRFGSEASIPSAQVPATAATITEVIAGHMSPGQLDQALAELPADLRATITGATATAITGITGATATSRAGTAPVRPGTAPAPAATSDQPAEDRVAGLEDQIKGLTEAVRVLAHGLEDGQLIGSGIDQTHVARAARLADEILIAARPAP